MYVWSAVRSAGVGICRSKRGGEGGTSERMDEFCLISM